MIRRIAARLGDDAGQGLITVLFTAMIILGLVVAATTITAAQAVPARRSVDSAAALAAAQGGIQDFLAAISRECGDGDDCDWAAGAATADPVPLGDGRAAFTWRVLNGETAASDGFVRVESTGVAPSGSPRAQERTLVADVSAGVDLTDLLYYSTYETQSSRLISAQNPPRAIAVDRAAGWSYEGTRAVGTIAWEGAAAYAGSEFPDATVCDLLWYDTDDAGEGRSSRDAASSFQGAIVDWGETGEVAGAPVRRGGSCEVMFSSSSEMNGAVHSKDALLISSSTDDGAGPMFRDAVETGWSPTDSPAADPARTYRAFAPLPESEPAVGSRLPETARTSVNLPAWTEPVAPTCVYSGATRIDIDGDVLVITSPLTPSGEGPCYESRPADPDALGPEAGGGESVLEARVPLGSGAAILVRDADAAAADVLAPQADDARRTPDDSLFWTRGVAGADTWGDAPSDVGLDVESTERWGDDDRSDFEDATGLTLDAVREHVAAELGEDPADDAGAALDDLLAGALADAFAESDAEDLDDDPAVFRTEADGETLAYALSVSGVEADAVAAPGGPVILPDDERSTDTVSATREVTILDRVETVTATATRLECDDDGGCELPEDTETGAQFDLDATRTLEELGARSTPVTAFPLPADRGAYARASGDIYVEGELDGRLSLVAENDIVVTGDVVHASGGIPDVPPTEIPEFSSGDALALVAGRDAVIHHPVACRSGSVDAIAATTPGFCPDDITGLYVGGIDPAQFDALHPSRQYVEQAETPVRRIDAVVYALGGSFVLANHDKGPELGTLELGGAVYQEHRGATGVEWETTTASDGRQRSGYALDYHYDGGLSQKSFPFLPGSDAVRVGSWTVTGTSEILTEESE
ncbi:hypothetical protein [Microbacterium karelineae]|uniref:hypothetical protein n=1 Tax=Microbacterium karelineae TaxID=2654283 RepID=UPI0012EA0012|nr:hypothetical protein [Microbacterium karelineae]